MLGQHVVRADVLQDTRLQDDGRLETASSAAEAVGVDPVGVHLAGHDVRLNAEAFKAGVLAEEAVRPCGAVLAHDVSESSDGHRTGQ
eukprot:scaffold5075_cov109-Isochrysis_galbana.AAC.10